MSAQDSSWIKKKTSTEEFWDQIVIGAGSSAINFLYSAFKGADKKFLQKRTIVIGKTELWAPMNPDHQMGQPGKLLRGVEEWKKDSNGEWQKQQYLSSGGYVKSLENLKDTVQLQRENAGMKLQFLNDMASQVRTSSGRYEVTTTASGRLYAPQVIVASGAGPGKKLNVKGPRYVAIIGEELLRTTPRKYDEILDATDYLYSDPPEGLDVLIQGGSATASWAAAHAIYKKADYLWLNSRGLQQIQTEGNPVARNTKTIQAAVAEERICRGNISRIEVVNLPEPAPRLRVYFKAAADNDLKAPVKNDNELKECSYPFHQVIHAIGGNPLGEFGPGAILDPSIRDNLEVLWDKDYKVQAGDTPIAMVHKNDWVSSLWIVGASLFRGAGREDLTQSIQNSYATVNDMLTHASRPPEGIANLKIRIQALTGHAETDPARFDWNLATLYQIENLLKAVYGTQITPEQRKELTGKILAKRPSQVFLFPKAEIKQVVETFKREKNLTIDIKKLQLDLSDINQRVSTIA